MTQYFYVLEIIIVINLFFCFYRALKGPTLPDRMVGANVISTSVVVLLALMAHSQDTAIVLDIAFIYCLLLVIINATIPFIRFLETGVLDV